MEREAISIEATLEEQRHLRRLVDRRVVSKQLSQRASIVLDCISKKE